MRFTRLGTIIFAGAVALAAAPAASAHLAPSTTIELDVHEHNVTATITFPSDDLAVASGIALPANGELDAASVDSISTYVDQHFSVQSVAGEWALDVDEVGLSTQEQFGTGTFAATTATLSLTPPVGGNVRNFTLNSDLIIHQLVTADVFVILATDWATGQLESTRDLGTISRDTVNGKISPLSVELDDGSAWQGFVGMVRHGVSHIATGTDHQLFLLTLLLPAPLLISSRRWGGRAKSSATVRRSLAVTLAFTLGHSITLALGAFGFPVLIQLVECLIALSIILAAAHALRPLVPAWEATAAGFFGLIHGLAFSATLSSLSLSGGHLVVSLLGFNLGIEVMQLAIVAVALPPLMVLARHQALFTPIRVASAFLAASAATGWLLDRLGVPNPVAAAADSIGTAAPWIAIALWAMAGLVWFRTRNEPAPRAQASEISVA